MKRGSISIFATLLFLPSLAWGQIPQQEALSTFVKANFAYRDGDYQQAIDLYESILEKGKESGALFYNLGNSYFKAGELGKAVLNYERAKIRLPRDGDVLANYRYVTSLMKRQPRAPNRAVPVELLERITRPFNINDLAVILVVLIVFFVGLFILSLYSQWPPRWQAGVLGPVFILGLVVYCGLAQKQNYVRNLNVILTPTECRFEPRDDATVHFELVEGEMVRTIETQGAWVKIQRDDNKKGWLPKTSLEKVMVR